MDYFKGYLDGIEDTITEIKVRYRIMHDRREMYNDDELKAVEEIILFMCEYFNAAVNSSKEDK